MKLITLNTWGGRIHDSLLEFLEHNDDIDIFCLQEIYNGAKREKLSSEFLNDSFNLYSDIENVLQSHVGYFRPHIEDWYGLAIFVKKSVDVKKEGDMSIYDVKYAQGEYMGGGNYSRNLQYLEFMNNGKKTTVANVHGLWNGKGKTDTEDRLSQSQKIKEFMDSIDGKKILCGDFNLHPNTESVKIIEGGMKNLIKEYCIASTRTSLYAKPEKYADYIFVSPDIAVRDFKVLQEEVSDHAALYLEF